MSKRKMTVRFQKAQKPKPKKMAAKSPVMMARPGGVRTQTEFIDECRAEGMSLQDAMKLWREEYCPHVYNEIAHSHKDGIRHRTMMCDCGDVQHVTGAYVRKSIPLEHDEG